MWKLIVGFVVFAGLALFLLSKGGDIDLSGEKHGRKYLHGDVAFVALARELG
jgi:hypothetical protein